MTVEEPRPWTAAALQQLGLRTAEQQALNRIPMNIRKARAGTDIMLAGEEHAEFCTILKGYAWRYQALENGSRQVLSIHLSGDMLSPHGIHLARSDAAVAAVSDCLVGWVPYSLIRQTLQEMPSLWEVLLRALAFDAAVAQAWLVNMGRRRGPVRVAFFLCEQFTRALKRRLINGNVLPFPFTQEQLADVLGITPVHINRAFRRLKEAEFLSLNRWSILMHNFDGLAAYAKFNPGYLEPHFGPRVTSLPRAKR